MSLVNFSTDVKVTSALDYASGTADRNGATLDMQNYEGVFVAVHLATIAAGAVTSIKMQQGDQSDLSDATDLAGTSVTIAADDDNEIKWIDLVKPTKRYVRVVVDKDASNACAESAIYYQYDGKKLPVDNETAGTIQGELHVSPDEGTA